MENCQSVFLSIQWCNERENEKEIGHLSRALSLIMSTTFEKVAQLISQCCIFLDMTKILMLYMKET